MTEKDKVIEQKVRRSGIFDFKDTYQFIYRWLTEEGYKVEEQKYQEEVQADSKKVDIIWVAEKKISDYFKNEIKLSFRITGLKNVEVEKEGRRVKMNDGSFEVKITGSLTKDYENKWENNPMMKFLRGVYDRYLIEGRIKLYGRKLFEDINDLTEQIKSYLTIEGMK